MSYADGWAAVNLRMPGRVPRVEFGAESHWPLVRAVTGLAVDTASPPEERARASQAFARAWNYDIRLTCLIGHAELDARRTNMGHGIYEADGSDYDAAVCCPFSDVEQVYAMDPWATYGAKDHGELVRRFDADYRAQRAAYPEAVAMTGTYVTLFSGLISMFGWEMMLLAGGLDPDRLGAVAGRYARWMQQYYDALADSETPVIYCHDDIVWTRGAVLRPAWYRQYIFPRYAEFWAPLLARGKKVIFVSDGDYTEFVDDIAAAG
ncbi:MAG: hypothetical protein V1772_14105, partial [Chloroflexota bacterium]